MLRTLGQGEEVEILSLLFTEARTAPRGPWVMLNMVESIDGATALKGGATALNDPDDRQLFLALRSVADVILVGAQTVRSEQLGPVRMSDDMLRHRVAARLDGEPRLAILTRSLRIEKDNSIFSDPDRRPILVVPTDADRDQMRRLEEVAELVSTDTDNAASVINALGPAEVILCEGGPSVNSLLIAAGLVDEINLTLSPVFGLGSSRRIASHVDELDPPQELILDRTLIGDRSLFLRYVKAAA